VSIHGRQDSIKAFKTAFDKTAANEELKTAGEFFKTAEKAYLFFGCFGIISIVSVPS
jgi:hypothetical protein